MTQPMRTDTTYLQNKLEFFVNMSCLFFERLRENGLVYICNKTNYLDLLNKGICYLFYKNILHLNSAFMCISRCVLGRKKILKHEWDSFYPEY